MANDVIEVACILRGVLGASGPAWVQGWGSWEGCGG